MNDIFFYRFNRLFGTLKSITNKELVMSANIRREQQTHARYRDEIARGSGNEKTSFVPGFNLSKSYKFEIV